MTPVPFKMPERFVFVVTYGRSGSTLLQNLLNALPGFQIRGENEQTALHLAQAWHVIRTSGQINRRRKRQKTTDQTQPWFGAELINAQTYGEGLARAFVENVLCPDPGTVVSGFKEIRYNQNPDQNRRMLNFLRLCFPNSKFVFNTRSHASVAKSGWWQDYEPENVAQNLAKADAQFAAYQQEFPECCHAVHYDDYVADPSLLCDLLEFVGASPDMALIQSVMDQKLGHLQDMKPPAE